MAFAGESRSRVCGGVEWEFQVQAECAHDGLVIDSSDVKFRLIRICLATEMVSLLEFRAAIEEMLAV